MSEYLPSSDREPGPWASEAPPRQSPGQSSLPPPSAASAPGESGSYTGTAGHGERSPGWPNLGVSERK